VVPSDGIMLIQAETGIGKELVARTIHNLDMRFEHNFVRANCAPIPPVCSRVGNSKPTSKPRSCRTLTDRTTHCCVLSFPCSSQAISGGSDRRLHEKSIRRVHRSRRCRHPHGTSCRPCSRRRIAGHGHGPGPSAALFSIEVPQSLCLGKEVSANTVERPGGAGG